MIPILVAVLSAAVPLWTTSVPFTPGHPVTLDAHAGPLLLSTFEMADTSNAKHTSTTLTITAANVGGKDAEVVFTATLLDEQGAPLATDDDSVEIEEGDVKKVRLRLSLPAGKTGPIASIKLAVVND
jgi:hypothetical protein